MKNLNDFFNEVRENFPEITVKADAEYANYWGDSWPLDGYSWFKSVADALNKEMTNGIAYKTHKHLFDAINDVISISSPELYNCIDVSFTENLFWNVPQVKATEYWQHLPKQIKVLYIQFHRCSPIE